MPNQATILTLSEVAKAIYVDADYDPQELQRLANLSSSFIRTKAGYDFALDEEKEPLAVECAMMYVRQSYFGAKSYNKEHDYTLGISALIKDLQEIAREKLS